MLARHTALAIIAHVALPFCPPAVSAQDPDRGFDRLFELGLPDPADGEYVSVRFGPGLGMPGHSPWDRASLENELDGRGWLLPPPEGQVLPLLVSPGDAPVLLLSRARLDELVGEHYFAAEVAASRQRVWRQLHDQAAAAGYPLVLAEAEPVDPADDIQWWTTLANDPGRDARQHDHGISDELLLIIAACWHRQGEPMLAAALAAPVLADADEAARVLDHCGWILAQHRYDSALRRFGVGAADWRQTHQALSGLLQQFGDSWPMAPAVELLAGRMERQIALDAAAAEAGGDEAAVALHADAGELTPAALHWWQAIGQAGPQQRESMAWNWGDAQFRAVGNHLMSLWISGDTWAENPADLGMFAGGTPIVFIRVLGHLSGGMAPLWNDLVEAGPEAIPWLAAGLGDDTLLPWVIPGDPWMTPILLMEHSTGENLSEHELQTHYRALNRPITRGELAQAMLDGLGATDHRHDDPESARDAALDLHDRLNGTSGVELAAILLENFGDRHARLVVTALLDNESPGPRMLVEQCLLHGEVPGRLAVDYVRRHRVNAADFVATLRAHMEEDDQPGSGFVSAREMEQMEFLAAGTTLEQLIATFLADDATRPETDGSMTPETFRRLVTLTYDTGNNQEQAQATLTSLVAGAARADDRAKVQILAQVALAYARGAGHRFNYTVDFLNAHPEFMQAIDLLLADDRPFVADIHHGILDPAWYARLTLLNLLHPRNQFAGGPPPWLSTDESNRLIDLSVRQLMAGDPPPEFPSADHVSADRTAELRREWREFDPGQANVDTAVEALTLDERVALAAAFKGWTGAPAGLQTRSWSVQEIRIEASAAGEDPAWWQQLQGSPLDEAMLFRIILQAHRALAGQRKMIVLVEQRSLGRGIRITVAGRDFHEPSIDDHTRTFADTPGGIAGTVHWTMITSQPEHFSSGSFGFDPAVALPADDMDPAAGWDRLNEPLSRVSLGDRLAGLQELAGDHFNPGFRFILNVGIPADSVHSRQ